MLEISQIEVDGVFLLCIHLAWQAEKKILERSRINTDTKRITIDFQKREKEVFVRFLLINEIDRLNATPVNTLKEGWCVSLEDFTLERSTRY